MLPEAPESTLDDEAFDVDATTTAEPEPERQGVSDDEIEDSESPPRSPTGPFDDSDQALADAAWEGVLGQDVVLKLEDDRTTRGRVTAVQRDTFTFIDKATGMVLVLPKRAVISLRGYVPPEPPERTGVGMIVGGSILTSVGIPVFISGAVILGICTECVEIHLPLLLIGAGTLGSGIPMLVRGANQRRAYHRALREHGLSASVSRTRHGWVGGLSFRF